MNPELRHRLGVHRYSSRGIQADRVARLARNRQRDRVPLSRHRVGTGLMFAPARLGISGRADVENQRVPPPPLLAEVSRAGDVATTAFPTLALSLFGGMVERKVQLVQPDQGPIAGNLPSPGARRQISALISSALRRPWKRSANASALPLAYDGEPSVRRAQRQDSRGELVVGHQGDDSEGMGTKRE